MTDIDIEPCEFEDIFELASEAKDDGVRAKRRSSAQWFRAGDVGMICLWEPGNRSSTKRISHWWVRDDRRGEGVGEALFERAYQAARESDATTLDIYVYDDSIVSEYGFEHRPGSSQAMDGAEYYVLDLE